MGRDPEAFRAAREAVDRLLRRFPYLAEKPDAVLVWFYWKYVDGVRLPKLPMRVLESLTNPETIIRRRRELGVKKEEPEVVVVGR